MRRKLLKLLLPLTLITSFAMLKTDVESVSDYEITSEYSKTYSSVNEGIIEGLPLVRDTFKFYNIKTDSAMFEFNYLKIEDDDSTSTYGLLQHGIKEESIFFFDLQNGVHLYNDDKEMDVEFVSSYESSEIDYDGKAFITETATYNLLNLNSNTEYKDFELVIDKLDSEGQSNGVAEYILDNESTDFWTKHDMQYYAALIIILILMILIIIMSLATVYTVIWWHRHISMAIYVDSKESFAHGEIVLDLVHANKYPEVMNAHEEELKLYAEGREIDAIFRRNPLVSNGFKIYITEDAKDNKLPFLSMMEAQKYNGFFIGIGNREYHAQYISDKKAKAIAKSHQRKVKNTFGDNREEILNEMNDEFRKEVSVTANHGLLGHISPNKSRRNSLRYKLLFPTVEELNASIKPKGKGFKMYHIYNGLLYELEVKYAGIFGSMVEFDIVNLEPGTIYPGISVSFDDGETIIPSSAIFGITKDKFNNKISKTDAMLAKPKEGSNGIEIWPEKVAKAYVGEQVLGSIKDILTKKHYEDEFDDLILRIDVAKQYHKDYVDIWFEKAKDSKDHRTGEIPLTLIREKKK